MKSNSKYVKELKLKRHKENSSMRTVRFTVKYSPCHKNIILNDLDDYKVAKAFPLCSLSTIKWKGSKAKHPEDIAATFKHSNS